MFTLQTLYRTASGKWLLLIRDTFHWCLSNLERVHIMSAVRISYDIVMK